MMNEAQLERFLREFHVDPVSGCWMWDGRTSCLGFAMFDLGGGFLSYALEVARAEWGGVPVPPGHMPLDTSWRFCRSRLCVCPDADHNPQSARRAFIQFDTTQVVEGMEDETPMPEVCGTIAPQVGVLYNVQGDEIPIYKVTLELHVDPEGLSVLHDSNADGCIGDEPIPCGNGKWAQNGRIVSAPPLRALLDAAEPYCTVWHGRPRQARPCASLRSLRGGRS
jgi:hypothetical protein